MAVRPKLHRRRRTKIIATLGPSSSTPDIMARLFLAGADVFRLNFSHGSHEDHAARFAMIHDLETRFDRPIGILADVQGPKLRVGRFSGGRVHLQTGHGFRLDLTATPGNAQRVNLPHPEIIEAASIGVRCCWTMASYVCGCCINGPMRWRPRSWSVALCRTAKVSTCPTWCCRYRR